MATCLEYTPSPEAEHDKKQHAQHFFFVLLVLDCIEAGLSYTRYLCLAVCYQHRKKVKRKKKRPFVRAVGFVVLGAEYFDLVSRLCIIFVPTNRLLVRN